VIGCALFRILPITRRNGFLSATIYFAAFSQTGYTIADLHPHRHLTGLDKRRHPRKIPTVDMLLKFARRFAVR
jgi:hypothetical protein